MAEKCERCDRADCPTLNLAGAHMLAHLEAQDDCRAHARHPATALRNLLAYIHCDGGQYTDKHGIGKSYADAVEIVCANRDAVKRAEAAEAKVARVKAYNYTSEHESYCDGRMCTCGVQSWQEGHDSALHSVAKIIAGGEP